MQTPLEISWQHVEKSQALEADIEKHMVKLEQVCPDIISCRVVVEKPHNSHHQGNLFNVKIQLRVPDKDIVVDKHEGDQSKHQDAHVCVRDAFEAARRQLESYNQKRQGL